MTPLPSIGTTVEVFGPDPGSARWDVTEWDDPGQGWDASGWRDVTGLAMSAEIQWGADRQVGVLSVASAGRLSVRSYDPLRLLDPSNTASPFWAVLRPGTPVRVRYGALVIRSGWLDTITYSHADRTGDWQASDAVPLLVQARVQVAAMGAPPTTLRALARALVARTGVPVTVEPDPEDGDPTIGAAPTPDGSGTLGVWDWLLIAAADVLRACWVDHDNVLRFRSYGDPRDLGLAIGGLDGIPIEDLVPTADLDAVFNVVAARPAATTWTEVRDAESVARYGERRLDRDRVTPNTAWWVANVLADRLEASLDYAPRTLRLRDALDLEALVTAGMVDTVRVAVESAVPQVDVSAALLGLTLHVDPESGYSADVVAYVPASTWDDAYTPPPIPPDPTPPPTVRVTRTYACTKDSRLFRSASGGEMGSGTESDLPVGYWQGSKNRALLDFASIPWTGVVKVVSARLQMTTSSQVNVGFGDNPKVEVRRVTEAWNEGGAGSPSTGNAVTWPGPSTTTSGSSVDTAPHGQGVRFNVDVSAIVRSWAPKAAGGSATTKRGFAIFSTAESDPNRTTEIRARETGGSSDDPVLELTLDVTT
jgi:hypothetical protein